MRHIMTPRHINKKIFDNIIKGKPNYIDYLPDNVKL